jgi:hypothetical protein
MAQSLVIIDQLSYLNGPLALLLVAYHFLVPLSSLWMGLEIYK